jgi:hypothetical protein
LKREQATGLSPEYTATKAELGLPMPTKEGQAEIPIVMDGPAGREHSPKTLRFGRVADDLNVMIGQRGRLSDIE